MSPLFIDTGSELNSPCSMSAEESNTAGSEREGEGHQLGVRGRKRQEKNRDAARKSRRKQTERADELHEELQNLERSSSALKKEIAALKKELHLYTAALERHKPFCRLKDATSSRTTSPLVGPPGVTPQASSSTSAAGPSFSTSLPSDLGLQTRDSVENTPLSSSTPTPPSLASPSSSPNELFTSHSSATAPDSVSFSTVPTPHSLFSQDPPPPPPLITSRPTNVPPACTSLAAPSSSLAAAALPHSGQGTIHESSSMSANTCFPALHSGALNEFLMTQASFLTASNVVPPYSHLAADNAGVVTPMDVAQLHPAQFSRNSINSSPPCSLLPPTLQDPALQSLPAPSPASAFTSKPSNSPPSTLSRTSLLSLLTVPSPLDVSQTTSSSFGGPQPPLSLSPLGDTSGDLSLSEFLEVNDWILNGTSHL